jgi:hypothetical protein
MRTKCARKNRISMWGTIYDSRELTRVNTVGLGVNGVLHPYQANCSFVRRCGGFCLRGCAFIQVRRELGFMGGR